MITSLCISIDVIGDKRGGSVLKVLKFFGKPWKDKRAAEAVKKFLDAGTDLHDLANLTNDDFHSMDLGLTEIPIRKVIQKLISSRPFPIDGPCKLHFLANTDEWLLGFSGGRVEGEPARVSLVFRLLECLRFHDSLSYWAVF